MEERERCTGNTIFPFVRGHTNSASARPTPSDDQSFWTINIWQTWRYMSTRFTCVYSCVLRLSTLDYSFAGGAWAGVMPSAGQWLCWCIVSGGSTAPITGRSRWCVRTINLLHARNLYTTIRSGSDYYRRGHNRRSADTWMTDRTDDEDNQYRRLLTLQRQRDRRGERSSNDLRTANVKTEVANSTTGEM